MPRREFRKPGKILVVKPSSLGDIVHSLPFLNAIRKCFSGADIHWVVSRGLEGLLEGHPMIDRLWVIEKDQWKRLSRATATVRELQGLLRGLRGEGYDLAVDLQGLLRSGLITRATGAETRMGFEEAREGSALFYTHKVEGGRAVHAVDRNLKVAARLGCDVSDVRFPITDSPFPLPFDGQYAVLAPGARWKTKRWPAERFGKLAARLPARSVIVGGKPDAKIAKQIVGLSGGKALSLAGKTSLRELSGVMRRAVFAVTNDSGPMHIAAAHEVPVFAIFGPTDPAATGPYGTMHTVFRKDLECSPCRKKKHCDDLRCIKGIGVREVYDAIMSRIYNRTS